MKTPLTSEMLRGQSQVLDLMTLHPRIALMIVKILHHQQVLTAYDAGQIYLNYRGNEVKSVLGNVSLDSEYPVHP